VSLPRQIAHGLRRLLRRDEFDGEIADEVRHFLEEAEAELIAGGASPDEARRRVRQEYGDALTVREDVRTYGWEGTVEALASDLGLAWRRLRRSPAFTVVTVLTLGLGIGAATAIYSAVRPVLFEPLPYPHAERVVSISDRTPDGAAVPATFGTFMELAARSGSFEALAVSGGWQPTITGEGPPERLDGQRVSAEYFRVLGVPPLLGPGFAAADDRPTGPRTVILADGLWRRRFGADSSIVGANVTLDELAYTVVGVMPRGFENLPGRSAEAWTLLQYDPSLPTFDGREWGHHLNMVGRLRPGVAADVARSELGRLASTPSPAFVRPAWAGLGQGLELEDVLQVATASVRPALWALLGAVAVLLAIACVNVTNLLMARGSRRRGELAVRAVLGAGRARLARQLLAESLLLAALGGLAALAVARVGLTVLVALAPAELPRLSAVTFGDAAFACTLGIASVVGVLVGLAPALTHSRGDLQSGAIESSVRTTGGHRSARRALVVVQVALAFVLLLGAGLLVRSLQRLFRVDMGFDPTSVVVLQVQATGRRFDDDRVVRRFFDDALDAVRGVPGVASAALSSQLPLSGERDQYGVRLEDETRADGDRSAYRYTVSPGYFRTLGIRVLRGRPLDEGDVAGAPPAVVINESFAKAAFPDGEAVGRRMHVGRTDLPFYTVVGVVRDVKHASLESQAAAAAYVTPQQWYFADPVAWLIVRGEDGRAPAVEDLRRAVWSVDSDQPIVRLARMEELVVRSEARRRFVLGVLRVFAVLALALATVGIYGVLAGSVADRTREMGVRAALGASRQRILGHVVGEGMLMSAVGVAIGAVTAALTSRALAGLVFGVSHHDPATYASVAGMLAVAAALACALPAARAARIDPMRTLRDE